MAPKVLVGSGRKVDNEGDGEDILLPKEDGWFVIMEAKKLYEH